MSGGARLEKKGDLDGNPAVSGPCFFPLDVGRCGLGVLREEQGEGEDESGRAEEVGAQNE